MVRWRNRSGLAACWLLGLLLAASGHAAGAADSRAAGAADSRAAGAADNRAAGAADNRAAPILLRADEIRHNDERDVIYAHGHVEITQGARLLLADTVTYNQRADLVTASGNVTLMEPTGEVAFADYMTLTNDMREGVVRHLRLRLEDDSRLAAASSTRKNGLFTEFRKAVFSPCLPCKEDPTRAPLWQLKAMRAAHDQQAHEIEYKDAFFEFYGIPVAYTPYLSHPDPTVKRKSGILSPSFGSSTEFGFRTQIPYYFNIAPDKDATFAPIFTAKDGAVAVGEYRQRFANGEFEIAGSLTETDERANGLVVPGQKETRGHVRGSARFDLDRTWRTGLDVFRATDDTYLRRYDLSNEDTLTSRAFLEGFRGRNYIAANSYLFQGLRQSDDPDSTPLILPMIDYKHIGTPGRYGERWSLDANLLSLSRKEGADSHRLSFKPGWEIPYRAAAGHITTVSASLQMDGYLTNDVPSLADPAINREGFTGRVFPQMVIDWRYPFMRQEGRLHQLIEPVVSIAIAPNGANSTKISNEDSQNFEFDVTNLMGASRFTGLDRVEGGHRVNYGLRMGLLDITGSNATIFFGQSYRLRKDNTFATGSGLDDHFSDYVGEVEITPATNVNLLYRTRLNKDDLLAEQNELELGVGPSALHLDVNYFFIRGSATNPEFGDREELTTALRSKITKNWSLWTSNRRDFEIDDTISWNLGAGYANECIDFQFTFTRSFTQDRDIVATDTYLLRIIFKHLGEVGI